MGKLFGTDGIRGVAGESLTAETAYRLGVAVAQIHRAKGILSPLVLIGKDTRKSGDLFESSIAAGLMAGGATAGVVGLTTTPAIAYLVRELGAAAGVMISASHNPARYNGLKVFGADGYKLSDEDEDAAESIILGHVPMKTLGHDGIGHLLSLKPENDRYISHVREVLGKGMPQETLEKRRILFDLSHGSACATAKEIFAAAEAYGFEVDFRAGEPDGEHINEQCGSTCMEPLAQTVVSGGYDMGFAFDGDADRCLAVDENGRILDGDLLIAAMAKDLKERGALAADTAVVTVLTNPAFHLYCAKHGIHVAVSDVGDRFVLREMLRIGAGIGGEQSGHIILPEYATTGDGQVSAAVLLGLLARSKGQRASELFAEPKPFPQLMRNVTVAEQKKRKVMEHPRLCEIKEKVEAELGDQGRVLIRPSGTEALIRVLVECKEEEALKRFADEIVETIEAICGTL